MTTSCCTSANYTHDSLADIMGAPIAIFPLINTAHHEAAAGILLRTFNEFNTLTKTPDIEITTSSVSAFEASNRWLHEDGADDMSDDEISAYATFLNVRHEGGDIWTVLIEQYLAPEHATTFRELGFILRGAGDRKFRRLPGPDSAATSTVQDRMDRGRVGIEHFATLCERVNPVWAGMMHQGGEGRLAEELDVHVYD